MDNFEFFAASLYLIFAGISAVRIANRRAEVMAGVVIYYAMWFALLMAQLLTN